MRRRRDTTTLAVLGTVTGAALVGTALLVVLRRRRRREPRLPQERRARRLLRTNLGPRAAERVLDSTYAHLHTLWDSRPRFRDRALSEPTETLILPALALYRALRSEGLDETRALGLVEAALVAERRRSRSAGVGRRARAARAPAYRARPSWLFALQGWELEWIADGEDLVSFDVLRCFYVDATDAYGSPELAAVFCALDDFSSDALGPGVVSVRAHTIARGGDTCAFRFRRISSPADPPPSVTAPRVIRFPHKRTGH